MKWWVLAVLVLMLAAGTATAYQVDAGWHRSDEPADLNTTSQTTSRTVTHYHPMSELSDAEVALLITPTPAPVIPETEPATAIPANATFVWGVVGLAGLIGLVLLIRYRGRKDGT